jgi:hypothetical protein
MPGDEAIQHIQAAERRTEADAINELKDAITHGAVGARLSGRSIFPPGADKSITHHTGPGSTPVLSPGSRQNPSLKNWQTAEIRADGTANFYGRGTPDYRFEVLRENVLRIWPDSQRSTALHENKALLWLVRDLQDRGAKGVTKSERRDFAVKEFHISARGFDDRVWLEAIRQSGLGEASKAGRKPKSPR